MEDGQSAALATWLRSLMSFRVVVKFMTLVNTNPIIEQGLLQSLG